MRDFLKMFGAVLAGLLVWSLMAGLCMMLFVMMVAAISSVSDKTSSKSVSRNTVLSVDLSKPLAERGYSDYSSIYNSLSFSDVETMGLNDICAAIRHGAGSDNVKAMKISLTNAQIPDIATAQAIRDCILEFRQSGKPVYAYSNNFSNVDYYIATACDYVYMAPMGDFMLRGLYSEVLYYKDALDKFGIDVQVIRHGKYKSAVEPFLLSEMSDDNRTQISRYLGDCWDEIADAIADGRGISRDDVDAHAESLDLLSNDSLRVALGFVDEVIYKDELNNIIADALGVSHGDISYVSPKNYIQSIDRRPNFFSGEISVIYAVGELVESKSGPDSFSSKEIVEALDNAATDSKVKAVVLRVNSPGGSAFEAEVIYQKLLELQGIKPVVVSMGGYAASGGYYISAPADVIVAEPTTITGSIGVFGLLMSPGRLLKNTLGINAQGVSTHRNSSISGGMWAKTSEQMAIYQQSVEVVYSKFVQHVADGRGMTFSDVDAIAQGRVWTGKSAYELGLVDTLGGLETAIGIAAELADLKSYNLKEYPANDDELSRIFSDLLETSARIYYGPELYEQKRLIGVMERRSGIQAYMPKPYIE